MFGYTYWGPGSSDNRPLIARGSRRLGVRLDSIRERDRKTLKARQRRQQTWTLWTETRGGNGTGAAPDAAKHRPPINAAPAAVAPAGPSCARRSGHRLVCLHLHAAKSGQPLPPTSRPAPPVTHLWSGRIAGNPLVARTSMAPLMLLSVPFVMTRQLKAKLPATAAENAQ